MNRWLPAVAGALLGLIFLFASVTFFLNLMPTPTFPEGSPIAHFMGAFGPTGYMGFVKACELLGGILVAIPRTRNIGLLVLVPILVNVVAFHATVTGGQGLLNPLLDVALALALYLLWTARRQIAGLLGTPS